MVDNIRPTGRVGAVFSATRLRSVKRDRKRRDQGNPQPEEETREADHAKADETNPEMASETAEKKPSTGQRIDVII